LAAAAFACGGDDGPPDLFEPKPECAGEMITPFAGAHPQVISKLEIGAAQDGFDLDGDGLPDNKLQGVRGLANPGIAGALSDYSLAHPHRDVRLRDRGGRRLREVRALPRDLHQGRRRRRRGHLGRRG
jgi:hypothetical protein